MVPAASWSKAKVGERVRALPHNFQGEENKPDKSEKEDTNDKTQYNDTEERKSKKKAKRRKAVIDFGTWLTNRGTVGREGPRDSPEKETDRSDWKLTFSSWLGMYDGEMAS